MGQVPDFGEGIVLDNYYFHYGQEDLSGELGDIQLLPNGTTTDPAA